MVVFAGIDGFEWDDANRNKIVLEHGITDSECEEVFFDDGKRVFSDRVHSGIEERFILIGKTSSGKVLFTVFTIRTRMIRIISARPLNKKERKLYE